MRIIALTAAALLAGAPTQASAAPASVHVTIGADLQKQAEKTYGVRDINDLARDLERNVTRALTKSGAYDGARIELTLVDAKPNRPTFKQMGDKPGLSFQSHGIGGARIEGKAIAPDGTVTPLKYSWYESDIRQTYAYSTWHDAQDTFGRFAYRLARGDQLASR
jgi:hypothetical protein